MLYDERTINLAKKFDIPLKQYYKPFYADCPVCGGLKTLHCRWVKVIGLRYFGKCSLCLAGGSDEDWVSFLDTGVLSGVDSVVSACMREADSLSDPNSVELLRKAGCLCPVLENDAFFAAGKDSLSRMLRGLGLADRYNGWFKNSALVFPKKTYSGVITGVCLFNGIRHTKTGLHKHEYYGSADGGFSRKIYILRSLSDIVAMERLRSRERLPKQTMRTAMCLSYSDMASGRLSHNMEGTYFIRNDRTDKAEPRPGGPQPFDLVVDVDSDRMSRVVGEMSDGAPRLPAPGIEKPKYKSYRGVVVDVDDIGVVLRSVTRGGSCYTKRFSRGWICAEKLKNGYRVTAKGGADEPTITFRISRKNISRYKDLHLAIRVEHEYRGGSRGKSACVIRGSVEESKILSYLRLAASAVLKQIKEVS